MKQYFIFLVIGCFLIACSNEQIENHNTTIISTHDFLNDFSALNSDGTVNIVVEIPAGSNQKWEVDKKTGYLEWERIGNDSLRVVKYLPYPANYGMVPRTWLPQDKGGDNDPIDIFLLGEAVERGLVVPAKIVGVIRMFDKGLQDDKLIGVPVEGLFSEISTLDQLNSVYPGTIEILKIWLSSYKSGKLIEILGVNDEIEALEILNKAANSFEKIYN